MMKSKIQTLNEIEGYINTLASLPVVKRDDNLLKKLSLLREKFANKTFQLVVLGQFKRGKTSLINALLGKNLLPTAIIPLTSMITTVKFGLKEKVTVKFLNGKSKNIKLSELSEYITEAKNPKNEKEVIEVTLEFPSDFLKNGIQIVDTPGVGSVYKHNTDVAYEFVPKADAGIFVVTADPPISDSELQFLKSIKTYLAKIIFVQNKIDQVEKKELQESLLFTKKIIGENVNQKNLQFFQLSAKLGLEGKIEKNKKKLESSKLLLFEESLQQLLFRKKESIFLLSTSSKLIRLIEELEFQLQLEKQALQMSEEELRKKIALFKNEVTRINQEKEESDYILRGQIERLTKQVLVEDIEILKEEKLPELMAAFEKFFQENKSLPGKDLAAAFNSFLEKSIKDIFRQWRKNEKNRLQDCLKTILVKFSNQTNQFIKRIIDLSSNLFDLKLQKFQADTSLVNEIEFKFSFDEFQVDIDLFTPIVSHLPKFFSNKLFYNKMKEDVLTEFDRHCGRSRYDFHERISKSIYDYQEKLNKALETTVTGIKKTLIKVLSEKTKKEKSQTIIKMRISQQEKILSSIKNNLKRKI